MNSNGYGIAGFEATVFSATDIIFFVTIDRARRIYYLPTNQILYFFVTLRDAHC